MGIKKRILAQFHGQGPTFKSETGLKCVVFS